MKRSNGQETRQSNLWLFEKFSISMIYRNFYLFLYVYVISFIQKKQFKKIKNIFLFFEKDWKLEDSFKGLFTENFLIEIVYTVFKTIGKALVCTESMILINISSFLRSGNIEKFYSDVFKIVSKQFKQLFSTIFEMTYLSLTDLKC